MEQVSREQDHVDISFLGQTHHFVEALPAIVTPDRITLVVTDMVVGGDKDADRVRVCVC